MDVASDLEGRYSHVPDAIHVEEKRHRVGGNNEGDQRAAQAPGLACNIDAQDGAAQNKGHRNAVDYAEREVVQG